MFGQFMEANHHYSNLVGLQKALDSVALRDAAKQIKVGSNLNPLTLLSNLGKGAGKLIGADKLANNIPMAFNPVIKSGANLVNKFIPKNIPQAELEDYLTNKFGKKGQQ
jgi:hypothetical protein